MNEIIELLKSKNNSEELLMKSIINSFEIETEYFIDVFTARYDISIEIGRPIKGLKESLETIETIEDRKILSTSIKSTDIDILVYSDLAKTKIYGIIDFLENFITKQ